MDSRLDDSLIITTVIPNGDHTGEESVFLPCLPEGTDPHDQSADWSQDDNLKFQNVIPNRRSHR